MFMSREIDIKLCQNYTKSYVQSSITSPKLPPIAVRYRCHVIHVTSISYDDFNKSKKRIHFSLFLCFIEQN